MKITLKTLALSMQSGAMVKLVTDDALSFDTKHRIKRIWKQVKKEWEELEETRIELCKKYGQLRPRPKQRETDPDETYYIFETPALEAEFQTELDRVHALEIEIAGTVFQPADLKRKLEAVDPLNADDYLMLEWLISDGEETPLPEQPNLLEL